MKSNATIVSIIIILTLFLLLLDRSWRRWSCGALLVVTSFKANARDRAEVRWWVHTSSCGGWHACRWLWWCNTREASCILVRWRTDISICTNRHWTVNRIGSWLLISSEWMSLRPLNEAITVNASAFLSFSPAFICVHGGAHPLVNKFEPLSIYPMAA